MATRAATVDLLNFGSMVKLVLWDGLLNGDVGAAVEIPDFSDKTVTFEGTFGTGGTIVFQGSNDGSNWYSLTDGQGNAISKTAAGIEAVAENPRYIRPSVTAGDGTTDLECRILATRSAR